MRPCRTSTRPLASHRLPVYSEHVLHRTTRLFWPVLKQEFGDAFPEINELYKKGIFGPEVVPPRADGGPAAEGTVWTPEHGETLQKAIQARFQVFFFLDLLSHS